MATVQGGLCTANRGHVNGFKVVSLLGAALFLWLFYSLLFSPGSVCDGFGIERSEALFVIARRASVLMLGFAVLLFLVRDVPPSPARRSIAAAVAVTFAGLAILGSYEIFRGAMKSSVWRVVATEVAFAASFVTLWVLDLRLWRRERVEPDR